MQTDAFHYCPPDNSWPRILYQDKDIVVVEKPSGLLSNPGKGEHLADCALSRLAKVFDPLYLVHRLDLATSGVMVFALRRKAEVALKAQFANRQVQKTYLALVGGQITPAQGKIALPLIADLAHPPRNKVCFSAGKPALTFYQTLWHNGPHSLVQLKPITGRSHQLRVHLLALGHPIVGDALYAPADVIEQADRLLLHATTLSFLHPYSAKPMLFSVMPNWQPYGVPHDIQLHPWPEPASQFTDTSK